MKFAQTPTAIWSTFISMTVLVITLGATLLSWHEADNDAVRLTREQFNSRVQSLSDEIGRAHV